MTHLKMEQHDRYGAAGQDMEMEDADDDEEVDESPKVKVQYRVGRDDDEYLQEKQQEMEEKLRSEPFHKRVRAPTGDAIPSNWLREEDPEELKEYFDTVIKPLSEEEQQNYDKVHERLYQEYLMKNSKYRYAEFSAQEVDEYIEAMNKANQVRETELKVKQYPPKQQYSFFQAGQYDLSKMIPTFDLDDEKKELAIQMTRPSASIQSTLKLIKRGIDAAKEDESLLLRQPHEEFNKFYRECVLYRRWILIDKSKEEGIYYLYTRRKFIDPDPELRNKARRITQIGPFASKALFEYYNSTLKPKVIVDFGKEWETTLSFRQLRQFVTWHNIYKIELTLSVIKKLVDGIHMRLDPKYRVSHQSVDDALAFSNDKCGELFDFLREAPMIYLIKVTHPVTKEKSYAFQQEEFNRVGQIYLCAFSSPDNAIGFCDEYMFHYTQIVGLPAIELWRYIERNKKINGVTFNHSASKKPFDRRGCDEVMFERNVLDMLNLEEAEKKRPQFETLQKERLKDLNPEFTPEVTDIEGLRDMDNEQNDTDYIDQDDRAEQFMDYLSGIGSSADAQRARILRGKDQHDFDDEGDYENKL